MLRIPSKYVGYSSSYCSPDNPEFPLRRLVKCSRCGTSFTGAWSKGKKKRYGYYFCRNRCGKGVSIPVETIHGEAAKMLKNMSLLPQTISLFNAFLRRSYYERTSSLQKKRERADEELKKLYTLRQALVEKNLTGVYTDDVFKEQNRMIEEKIKIVQIAKSDSIIEKYNLKSITEFVADKFPDLSKTFEEAELEEKRVLLCSIFPSGMQWSYPGYSNTQKSPFFQAIQALQNNNASFGAPGGIRTPDPLFRRQIL
ncbi:MAG: zinc ribbon domain-containing protein, partial [Patescibacteria group bacterium]